MEFEFDKEIDAILRKARIGEAATSFDSHPDADEISAFAENAVTGAARTRFTSHLAECTRCRKILSNVILLNSEADAETASSVVPVAAPVAAALPWYRRLFVFPQIAYTMGGLVLLFSGFFGYLIVRNLPGAGGADVSYSANRPAEKAVSQAPAISTSNSASSANSSNASTTAANPAAPPANSTADTAVPSDQPVLSSATPAPSSNANAIAVLPKPADRDRALKEDAPVLAMPQATPPAELSAQDDVSASKNEDKTATESRVLVPSPSGTVRRERDQKDEKKTESENSFVLDGQELNAKKKAARSEPDPRKQPAVPGATRSVGGKSFNNVGGIWFDAAYSKQKQKTVNRGTSDFQKLDSGLRSIADSLGGTIVVLWKGKAYRIQ